MEEKIKQLFQELFPETTAKEIDEDLWLIYTSAILSNDFQCWLPYDQFKAAELYKKITKFFIQLETLIKTV